MLAGALISVSFFASYATLPVLTKSLARTPPCLSADDRVRNAVFGKPVETNLPCCLLRSAHLFAAPSFLLRLLRGPPLLGALRVMAVDPGGRTVHSDSVPWLWHRLGRGMRCILFVFI